jgi:hypothetical protein
MKRKPQACGPSVITDALTACVSGASLLVAGISSTGSRRSSWRTEIDDCHGGHFAVEANRTLRTVSRRLATNHRFRLKIVSFQAGGQDPELLRVPGTVTLPLCSRPNASPFWIMLLLVSEQTGSWHDPGWQPNTRRPHQALGDRTPMAVWRGDMSSPLGENPANMMD